MRAGRREATRVWVSRRELLITLTSMASYFKNSPTSQCCTYCNLSELVCCMFPVWSQTACLYCSLTSDHMIQDLFDWPHVRRVHWWNMWQSHFWQDIHEFTWSKLHKLTFQDHDNTKKNKWDIVCAKIISFFVSKTSSHLDHEYTQFNISCVQILPKVGTSRGNVRGST